MIPKIILSFKMPMKNIKNEERFKYEEPFREKWDKEFEKH